MSATPVEARRSGSAPVSAIKPVLRPGPLRRAVPSAQPEATKGHCT